jgi:hypothetical protein
MSIVMEHHEVTALAIAQKQTETPWCRTTTLYDLMAALQAVVGAEDALVVTTVVHLLRSRRLTWLKTEALRGEAHSTADPALGCLPSR